MKALKLTPNVKKGFKSTTYSNHDEPIAENILDRKFDVAETDCVRVSDITYIITGDSFYYLMTLIDLADRMVVG